MVARDILTEQRASRLARDLLMSGLIGGLIALGRRYFDLHLGIPGHTGVLWMSSLVLGRMLIRRDGAGVLMGTSTALWGEAFEIRHSLPYNLMLYSLPGLSLDLLVRLPGFRLTHPAGAVMAGGLAHTVKFLFILAYATGLDVPKNFLLPGIFTSLGLHVLFGASGGLVAAIVRRTFADHPGARKSESTGEPEG